MLGIHSTSLSATLDSASEMLLFHEPLISQHCEEVISLLVSRQVRTGKNSAFFLPFTTESEIQPRLFSGEKLHTDFAYRHIQMIECARLLVLLGGGAHAVQQAISLAEQRMHTSCYSKFCAKGECKAISIAYMRYLNTTAFQDTQGELALFIHCLAGFRDGKGKWGGFPYYYTLLMLSELPSPLSRQELDYAAPTCEKLLNHTPISDRYAPRRQFILTNAISRN